MSFETIRRDIYKRLQDNWATTEIAFPNIPFADPSQDDTWIAIKLFEDNVNRINIGEPALHRHNGTIGLEINVPKNTGTKTGRGHADTLATLFREAQFNGITCREPNITEIGDVEGWYRLTVAIPFYWDGSYVT